MSSSGEGWGAPKCAGRAAGPASKRVAEGGGIAKSNRDGHVVIGHGRLAHIPDRNLRSQLVEQAAKGNPLLRETPTQSPLADLQPACDGRQRRLSAEVLQQQGPDLSG